MNESPYCGVNSMAKLSSRRATCRSKHAACGLRKMRAPSHHTSPLLGTSLSAWLGLGVGLGVGLGLGLGVRVRGQG